MNYTKPHFLILSGDGINCERETKEAFLIADADATIMHVNDLLASPSKLLDYQGLAIPGGFSFGDELGSGQILALKLKFGLADEFKAFVAKKRPIIGICNGFQVLVKLGLLPFPEGDRVMGLAANVGGHFQNRWTRLITESKTVCKWATSLQGQSFELPARHGEGRVVFHVDQEEKMVGALEQKGQIVFRYSENYNGSSSAIAGLCDETGMILGMMPHPEAFVYGATYRQSGKAANSNGVGQSLFINMVNYLNQMQEMTV